MRDHRLNGDVNSAAVAGLIGDDARATMLLALGGEQPLSASERARRARITPQTASGHLAKLVSGGLLTVARDGRSRYYRIARPDVARAIEALAVIAPAQPARTLNESERANALRVARTCDDHLAGCLGAALFQALVRREALCDIGCISLSTTRRRSVLGAVALGPHAATIFGEFNIDVRELRNQNRQFAPACFDWTEAGSHLGASLGAALCNTFIDYGWCRHRPHTRAVVITESGRRALQERFGIEL